ncbi:class I SAM-dependent methyltransferase [Enterococcus sp. DIV0800]|uniref:class I SAM-dependent methyltransferase n=1 Tax=unclassified Enterococcus TaxID=2608891 RepID=UPI003D2F9D02
MKNIYDNNAFFESYSQMARSQQGLAGAGEWQTLKALLPDFKDKRVLDLGCGYGWHCLYAAEHGAASVVGVDLSEKMLAVARQKNSFANVVYLHDSIDTVDFEAGSFDIVLSSLAIHYIEDFTALAKNIAKWLAPTGQLIFSVEHPIFTAEGTQDWIYDQKGAIAHFPVDNYFYEGKRTAHFLGANVTKYHRTLTTYLDSLLTNGFQLKRIVEPTPPKNMWDIPGMKDEMRRPMMLIVKAEKNQA